MSYTTVYAMPPDRPLIEIAEFENAFGAAMRVWSPLMERYLIPPDVQGMERLGRLGRILMGKGEEARELWQLHKDPRLTRSEKAVHLWTYDKAVVEADRLGEMADCFDDFEQLHPPGGASHLPELAVLYRSYQPQFKILGLCVRQTSVAHDVWRKSCDEGEGEDDETSRLYDASVDNDHFFVMASLDRPEDAT